MFGPKPRVELQAAQYQPYKNSYDEFLGQLKNQAMGNGPSLAENMYRQRQGEGLQQMLSMQAGRNPGMARQAAYAGGQMQQGLNSAATDARLAEQQQAQQMYGGMLNSANQADFQRSATDLQSRLAVMQMPSDWDKLMNAGVTLGAAAMQRTPKTGQ